MSNNNYPNDGRRTGDPCPDCGGTLTLRQLKRTKGFFLGCMEFPTCDWACLPSPIDVKIRRARDRERRRTYCINREKVWDEAREALWDEEDRESRIQFLRRDEVSEVAEDQEDPYSIWDAIWGGRA